MDALAKKSSKKNLGNPSRFLNARKAVAIEKSLILHTRSKVMQKGILLLFIFNASVCEKKKNKK